MALGGLHQQAMAAVRGRSFWRGESKETGKAFGLSQSYINGLSNGSVRMTDKAARRIMDAARLEELELADRIERELHRPTRLKECE